ncbi:hypothetical protein H8959_006709 [Pygathrix nigripes]
MVFLLRAVGRMTHCTTMGVDRMPLNCLDFQGVNSKGVRLDKGVVTECGRGSAAASVAQFPECSSEAAARKTGKLRLHSTHLGTATHRLPIHSSRDEKGNVSLGHLPAWCTGQSSSHIPSWTPSVVGKRTVLRVWTDVSNPHHRGRRKRPVAQLPELQGQGVRAPGQWLPPACCGGSPEASAWPLLCHGAQPSSRHKTQGPNSEGRNGAGIGLSTPVPSC